MPGKVREGSGGFPLGFLNWSDNCPLLGFSRSLVMISNSTIAPGGGCGDDAEDMIQLSFQGLELGSSAELDTAREEFARSHCLLLKNFLHPSVLKQIRGMGGEQDYFTREDIDTEGKVFARELTLRDRHPLAALMMVLLNQPDLFQAIREISGSKEELRFFKSRVFELKSGSDHYDDWHDDHEKGQIVGLSLNLSVEPVEGGEFEIRNRTDGQVYRRISGTQFGDAHIFEIGANYQHRVLPVTGSTGRRNCAGWFCSEPDFRTEMKKLLSGEGELDQAF